MKSALLMLLCLAVATPSAIAADWLSWRKVGDATLTWGPFTVYTSQLRAPDGQYHGLTQDQALIITYARHIDREDLVNATREQWQAQGILAREAQSQAWLRMLAELWPDVEPGTQLAFVLNDKQGEFWYRASAAQRALCRWGHGSRRISAKAFSPSGSIRVRNTRSCVSSSLEVKNETFTGFNSALDDATDRL